MSKIRHLAIMTDDPPKLADFYKTTFGLQEVFRQPQGAIYLSDGYLNLAVLKNRNGETPGVHHFGFMVDDVQGTAQSALNNGAQPPEESLPRDGRFAESYIYDPVGQRIDLSAAGWKVQ